MGKYNLLCCRQTPRFGFETESSTGGAGRGSVLAGLCARALNHGPRRPKTVGQDA